MNATRTIMRIFMRTGMMESVFAKAIELVFNATDGIDGDVQMCKAIYDTMDMPFDVDNLVSVGLERCFTGPEGTLPQLQCWGAPRD